MEIDNLISLQMFVMSVMNKPRSHCPGKHPVRPGSL